MRFAIRIAAPAVVRSIREPVLTLYLGEDAMNISTIQLSGLGSISGSRKVFSVGSAVLARGLVLLLTVGCSIKNYVRSQTAPIIQQTNELDNKTAPDPLNIQDTNPRAKSCIAGAKTAAATADQHAVAAGESADTATKSAQEA